MSPTILVGLIIAAPVALLMFLRVNALLVFLSLCLGSVLLQYVGPEAMDTAGILAAGTGHANKQLVSLGLVLLPAVFTTIFMMRTVKNNAKLAFNFLPALAVGVLFFLLTEPFYTPGLRYAIENDQVWKLVQGSQPLAIGVSAIISVLFIWMQRPKKHKEEEGHHHKK